MFGVSFDNSYDFAPEPKKKVGIFGWMIFTLLFFFTLVVAFWMKFKGGYGKMGALLDAKREVQRARVWRTCIKWRGHPLPTVPARRKWRERERRIF
jgi:hypothetical protein